MKKTIRSLHLFLCSMTLVFAVAATAHAAELWNGTKYMDSLQATGAHKLHAIGITGRGVSAAVLDQPYDVSHKALAGRIIAEASAGFSLENGSDRFRYSGALTNVYGQTDQGAIYWGTGLTAVAVPGTTNESIAEYGQGTDFKTLFSGISHGTHVAGTVAAMAPGAKLVLATASGWTVEDPSLRDSSSFFGLYPTTAALEYVASVARQYNIVAMNNSWGSAIFDSDVINENQQAAIDALNANGVAVVFSTGNDGESLVSSPSYYTGVIPVGAYAQDNKLASFSDHNKEGVPDARILLAPGVGINSSGPYDNRFIQMTGTSMASPHVTGAITLLASGARNASTEEIYAALWNSADVAIYDGGVRLAPNSGGDRVVGADFLSILKDVNADSAVDLSFISNFTDTNAERTLDEWRQLARLDYLLKREAVPLLKEQGIVNPQYDDKVRIMTYLLKNGEENVETYRDFGPLGSVELHTIQVDKAYRWLTDYRMNLRGAEAAEYNAAAPAMLSAFGGELGAELSQETSGIFQRLDAQTTEILARTGRQMSPQWTASAVEYAQLGVAGLHRSLSRKGEISRLAKTILPSAFDECEPCEPESFSASVGAGIWVEGFGSFGDRSGSIKRAGYDGHFAGTSLGFDVTRGAFTFGAFGSWADFRAKGSDGRSDGDWYNAGLYGRFDRERYFVEASASYVHGRFDTSRHVEIPGARFTTTQANVFIDMPGETRTARAKNRVNGFAVRLAGGYDFEPGCDFVIGPRVEGSLNRSHVSGYRENGAGALTLDVNGYNQTYAEAGAGFAASRTFRRSNGSSFVAWGKVMGLYGMGFGGDLQGKYVNNGSAFRFSPKRHSGMWLVPEAALTWSANERVSVTAAYAGRFGKKHSENSGSLNFGVSF